VDLRAGEVVSFRQPAASDPDAQQGEGPSGRTDGLCIFWVKGSGFCAVEALNSITRTYLA